MSAHRIFRLRNPALLIALAAAFPVIAYSAEGAGSVDFASGAVTAVNASGVQRPLTRGAEIGNGDTVRTGEGSRAQVRFSDGALVSLQAQTEFRIDDFHYSGKADGQEKGFFSLLKGGLRTITGLVGRSNRSNYKVSTGVATIGIRGTEYMAVLDESGTDLTVHTGEGLVEVCNDAGCILLAAGETGVVGGKSAQPRRTQVQFQAPSGQTDGIALATFTVGDNWAGLNVPTSPMPTTGTATYSTILLKTSVVESTGTWAPGTLNAASVSANFGTQAVSSSVQGSINGVAFSASGLGSFGSNTWTSVFSGAILNGTCTIGCGSLTGTFYGPSAERVGISYSVKDIAYASYPSPVKVISGSAILGQ